MARYSSDRGQQDGNRRLEATKRKVTGWNLFVDRAAGGLTPLQSMVWVILYRHAEEGVVTLANSVLARILRVSDKTVRRAIAKLRQEKLLLVVRQGGMHVGATTYRLAVRDLNKATRAPSGELAAAPIEASDSEVDGGEIDRQDAPVAGTEGSLAATIPASAELVSGPAPTDTSP